MKLHSLATNCFIAALAATIDHMQSKAPSVLPWSHSTRQAYETCPRRYYLTKISKEVKEPQTQATLHGNEVHKALEKAILKTDSLPAKYKHYIPIVERVSRMEGKKLVEHKFALTNSFQPTTFFAPNAWVRGAIDFANIGPKTAVVLDWKTGKVKTDKAQLKLMAAVTFAAYPLLETVKTGYVWLAGNKVTSAEFAKSDTPAIWQEFLPSVQRMEHSLKKMDFPPKPSGLCREWCPVGKALCEFCGR